MLKWLSRLRIRDARIYVSGENLWTWSPLHKYTKDFDVVTVCYGSDTDITSEETGDGYNYPTMSTFSLGLQIGF